MNTYKRLLVVIALTFPIGAHSQIDDEVVYQLLKTMSYSETAKASFKLGCQSNNPLSLTPQYKKLCPKLESIPASVIETAALPYVKHYVSTHLAKQAILFWSSFSGRKLTKKILRDIESGFKQPLDDDDLKLINLVARTEYGIALNKLGADKEMGVAVAQAMLNYEP